MSKVKEQMLRQQEEEFELDISYAEWLRDNQEPSETEISKMAKEFLEPYNLESFYLFMFSMNNVGYRPKVV